jgi:hypothetical protein
VSFMTKRVGSMAAPTTHGTYGGTHHHHHHHRPPSATVISVTQIHRSIPVLRSGHKQAMAGRSECSLVILWRGQIWRQRQPLIID